jgi:hypothetical protein
VALAVLCALTAPVALGQGAGSIEFSVLLTPTMGRPEPGRQTAVLLLSKSFADIRREAQESLPEPDLDEFIASLEVTPELKEWMKRTKVVNLSGQDFMRALKNDDIMKVPEFLEAYLARNAVDVAVGFPKPKYKESEREKDPVKYEKQRQDYKDGIRKFMDGYPHSRDGLDLHLVNLNSGQRWARRQADRLSDVHRRALEWANTRYLVARAETDLQGRAGFVNVPPGDYWLSTLDREVAAGDVRMRWDTPLSVRAGQVTRIELNNYNSVPRESAAQ